MIYENEILMLLLGIVLLWFVLRNISRLKRLRSFKYLIISFSFSICSWTFTILEGFLFQDVLNTLEHLCYLLGALFLIIWVFEGNKQETNNGNEPHSSA